MQSAPSRKTLNKRTRNTKEKNNNNKMDLTEEQKEIDNQLYLMFGSSSDEDYSMYLRNEKSDNKMNKTDNKNNSQKKKISNKNKKPFVNNNKLKIVENDTKKVLSPNKQKKKRKHIDDGIEEKPIVKKDFINKIKENIIQKKSLKKGSTKKPDKVSSIAEKKKNMDQKKELENDFVKATNTVSSITEKTLKLKNKKNKTVKQEKNQKVNSETTQTVFIEEKSSSNVENSNKKRSKTIHQGTDIRNNENTQIVNKSQQNIKKNNNTKEIKKFVVGNLVHDVAQVDNNKLDKKKPSNSRDSKNNKKDLSKSVSSQNKAVLPIKKEPEILQSSFTAVQTSTDNDNESQKIDKNIVMDKPNFQKDEIQSQQQDIKNIREKEKIRRIKKIKTHRLLKKLNNPYEDKCVGLFNAMDVFNCSKSQEAENMTYRRHMNLAKAIKFLGLQDTAECITDEYDDFGDYHYEVFKDELIAEDKRNKIKECDKTAEEKFEIINVIARCQEKRRINSLPQKEREAIFKRKTMEEKRKKIKEEKKKKEIALFNIRKNQILPCLGINTKKTARNSKKKFIDLKTYDNNMVGLSKLEDANYVFRNIDDKEKYQLLTYNSTFIPYYLKNKEKVFVRNVSYFSSNHYATSGGERLYFWPEHRLRFMAELRRRFTVNGIPPVKCVIAPSIWDRMTQDYHQRKHPYICVFLTFQTLEQALVCVQTYKDDADGYCQFDLKNRMNHIQLYNEITYLKDEEWNEDELKKNAVSWAKPKYAKSNDTDYNNVLGLKTTWNTTKILHRKDYRISNHPNNHHHSRLNTNHFNTNNYSSMNMDHSRKRYTQHDSHYDHYEEKNNHRNNLNQGYDNYSSISRKTNFRYEPYNKNTKPSIRGYDTNSSHFNQSNQHYSISRGTNTFNHSVNYNNNNSSNYNNNSSKNYNNHNSLHYNNNNSSSYNHSTSSRYNSNNNSNYNNNSSFNYDNHNRSNYNNNSSFNYDRSNRPHYNDNNSNNNNRYYDRSSSSARQNFNLNGPNGRYY